MISLTTDEISICAHTLSPNFTQKNGSVEPGHPGSVEPGLST